MNDIKKCGNCRDEIADCMCYMRMVRDRDAEIASLAAEVARLESEAERIATNRALDARKASDAWAKMKRDYEDHVDDLTDQLEIERMRQVACMTIAGANTRESAKAARQMHDDYKCAAVDDVSRAVDREMRERERAETAERELAALRAAVGWLVEQQIFSLGKHHAWGNENEERVPQEHAEALRKATT